MEPHGTAHGVVLAPLGEWVAAAWWDGDDAVITAHATNNPAMVAASIELRGRVVRTYGDESLWSAFPAAFVLNRDWAPVIVTVSGPITDLPFDADQFRSLDDPEHGLDVTPCPDGRSLIVQGGRSGAKFVVWDAVSKRQVATVVTGGYPGKFSFRSRTELWDGQLDTLYRIDSRQWSVRDARRLRREPDGSFIADIAFNADGSTCAIAWSKRTMTHGGAYAAPAGAAALLLDGDNAAVRGVVHVPEWLDEVVPVSGLDLLARTWGTEGKFLRLTADPDGWSTFPPRPPGAQDWR